MDQGAVVREWRCTGCSKLLGVVRHKRIYLKFGSKHHYIVTRPATAICRRCDTLNEVVDEHGPP